MLLVQIFLIDLGGGVFSLCFCGFWLLGIDIFFGQFFGQYVGMDVEYGLFGVWVVVEDEVEVVVVGVCCCQFCCEGDYFGQQSWVFGCEFGDGVVFGCFGDDEEMYWCLGCDVVQSEEVVCFGEDFGWDFFVEDVCED